MTTVTITRRRGKYTHPVDLHAFGPHIEQAMNAFQQDVTYAVEMARAAITIARKREIWQARRDARQAG